MTFAPLIQALTAGATVITPTNRLQREILWLYSQSKNNRVISTPNCFSYENWLKACYQNYIFQNPTKQLYTLIDNQQLAYLWNTLYKEITGRKLKTFELQQALSALKNCELCLSTPEGSDFLYHPNAQIFQKTWLKLETYLQHNHLLPFYRLATILSQSDYFKTPSKIIFACFDMFHPQQEQLILHLQQRNIEIAYFDFNHVEELAKTPKIALDALNQAQVSSRAKIYLADDDEQELTQIILWLKTQLNLGQKRIGVIIPNLSQQLHKIKNRLRQHFDEHILHFSLGQTLFNYPIIKHGMMLLAINPNLSLTREQCRLLLRSPLIRGFYEEKEQRNKIALKHKSLQEAEIPFKQFCQILIPSCPILAEILTSLISPPKFASIPQWIDYFGKKLYCFDFPGEKTLNHEAESILQKFYLQIEELHRLNLFEAKFNFNDILSELEMGFRQQIHQPPQDFDGIHILGWLESSGFSGDSLWIANFVSQLIPQPINLSSLLPIHWQKNKKLPRTDANKETQIASQIFQRLLHGHQEVVISFAKHIEQQPQWPSPLLPKNLIIYEALQVNKTNQQLLIVEDTYLLPLKPNEQVRGGSHLMSSHAKCPFQAFAKYRLHAEETFHETLGLSPIERGQLLHQILYYIWSELKSQHALLKLQSQELEKLIDKAIHKSIEPLLKLRPYSLDPFLTSLEEEHLKKLIHHALEIDKKRPSFQILGLEKEIELNIDDWTFQLRYDRIDSLDNGDHCVIDYKTSIPSPLPWNSTKPIHPQILMYALADKNIQALVFMALKAEETQISGISVTEIGIPGVKSPKEEWVNLQQQWLLHLQENITEIKNGICPPKPFQSNICQQCKFQDLCRFEGLDTIEN